MNDNLISGVLQSKGFGSNVQSVAENDNAHVLRIQSSTGEGYMTLYMVMKGVYVMFDEFHLESCESEFRNMENVFCVDHCRQGRIEHENLLGNKFYMESGDLKLGRRINHSGRIHMPNGYYYGMTIGFELEEAEKSIRSQLPGIDIDIEAIVDKFSASDKTNSSAEEYFIRIVGPSGSGKTTICNMIARFYDTTSGSISLGGHKLTEFTCDSLLSNISMVFQNVYLFNDTIRANICFGRDNVTEEEMIEAAKKARCHDFIMELPDGYDTVIGEGGGTLSGGQKQRISIARAILKDAPIIILDESTASIDPENEHLVQGAITELSKGKTVIIIAHRLATIESVDQILVVDNGRLIETGTHAQLLSRGGKYSEFVKIRQKAENWQMA